MDRLNETISFDRVIVGCILVVVALLCEAAA